MWKKVMTWVLGLCTSWTVNGQKAGQADLKVTQTDNQTYAVAFTLSGENVLQSPAEGLWSVATDWQNDWMSAWVHGSPTQKENVNGWTILTGKLPIGQGEMLVRDAYRLEENGLIHGVRRYQWAGKDTLRKASLSVRFQWRDGGLKPFMPGILYYGNPAGANRFVCSNKPGNLKQPLCTPCPVRYEAPVWPTNGGRWELRRMPTGPSLCFIPVLLDITSNTAWPKPYSASL